MEGSGGCGGGGSDGKYPGYYLHTIWSLCLCFKFCNLHNSKRDIIPGLGTNPLVQITELLSDYVVSSSIHIIVYHRLYIIIRYIYSCGYGIQINLLDNLNEWPRASPVD